MKETPFFFPNGSYKLFGVLHEPEKESNGCGFVFCHPFAEEKLWTHRVFVNFARELADLGYTVLRFDYMGHGDSEGIFSDSSIETRLSDIKCAILYLKEKMGFSCKIGLLGLRLGATLAALAAEEIEGIKNLILWDPIINGETYMRQMLRINISTQSAVYREVRYNTEALIQMMKKGGTVNVDGYEISWPLYEQTINIDMLDGDKKFLGSTILVQISKKEGKYNKNLEKLRTLYSNCEITLAVEEPFWKEIRRYYFKAENLFNVTLKWLRNI